MFEFRSDAAFDVAGFGTNAIDHIIGVEVYPAFNTKVELTSYQLLPGGEVASTLVALQRLGVTTAYAGSFGGDAGGRIGLDSLLDEGVNIDHARTIKDAYTQIAFIIVDGQTGERTIIWKRDERLAYHPDDAPLDLARSAKVLHVTANDTAAAIAMARAAREAGTIVSLDVDNVFDGIDELLELTDIAIASSDFLEELTGIRDRLSAMTEVSSRHGCRIVGATLGSSGSCLLADGVFVETPACLVPGGCVDTTGAGDAFRAGFLYGILAGASIDEAARCANAVAALKCRSTGARTALPTKDEVRSILRKS